MAHDHIMKCAHKRNLMVPAPYKPESTCIEQGYSEKFLKQYKTPMGVYCALKTCFNITNIMLCELKLTGTYSSHVYLFARVFRRTIKEVHCQLNLVNYLCESVCISVMDKRVLSSDEMEAKLSTMSEFCSQSSVLITFDCLSFHNILVLYDCFPFVCVFVKCSLIIHYL